MLKILKRNKTIAGILAIFAGTIGLHCFYMGKYKKGILYLLFFWTGIPTILGILDGARLFTQEAEEGIDRTDLELEENSLVRGDEVAEAEETEEIEEDIEEVEEESDVEDLDDDDEDDSEEDELEDEEESEMDEKIKKFRNKNSRRAK